MLWWAAFAPKVGLVGRDAVTWLVWPMGYTAYALARGLASGFYPYPFLDVSALGILQVSANIAALALSVSVLGFLLIGMARVSR